MRKSDDGKLLGRSSRAEWLWFAVPLIVYAAVATQQLTLPGVYMDSVNPDYLVVRVLNWTAEPFPIWILEGNYIANRFPVLLQIYHGTQQFWLGLPLYAVFGTDVVGIRLTHAMFAVGILAALFLLLLKSSIRPWACAMVCGAMACDASFSYAFRTQSYITMAPVAWLLLSILWIQQAFTPDVINRSRQLLFSGLLFGIATVGYFVYAFFLPALVLAVALMSRHAQTSISKGSVQSTRTEAMDKRAATESVVSWSCGVAAGASAYIFGYLLIVRQTGGFRQSIAFLQNLQSELAVFNSSYSLVERIHFSWLMLQSVFANWWHHQLMFGTYENLVGTTAKMVALLLVPVLLWATAELTKRASNTLRILICCEVCFLLVSLIFGKRLGGHHFMPLLPIAYATLAIGLWDSADVGKRRRLPRAAILSAPFVILAGLNVAGQVDDARWLRETRGVGLFSDAVNELAHDLTSAKTKPFVFFPDWGLFMPVVLISRGTVAMSAEQNDVTARQILCSGRDVAVAIIEGDRRARIKDWQKRLEWSDPAVTIYRQADSTIVFELATFSGNRNAEGCTA